MQRLPVRPHMDFGFGITLQVRHPRLPTDAWRRALRLRPGRSWVAGQPRTTQVGAPLPGVYKQSYCFFHLSDGLGSHDFARALRAATRRLARHVDLARRWRRSGGTLDFYVVIHGPNAMGIVVPPDLLVEVGKLGISLGIEALAIRQRGSSERAGAGKRARLERAAAR